MNDDCFDIIKLVVVHIHLLSVIRLDKSSVRLLLYHIAFTLQFLVILSTVFARVLVSNN